MGERVLVPYDESEPSSTAFEFAVAEHPDADITLLHAIDFLAAGFVAAPGAGAPAYNGEWPDGVTEDARSLLVDVERRAFERGVEATTESAIGRPADVILSYLADNDVDRVVIGSHHRDGVDRLLRGSVAETVVRRSPVPVTVV